MNSPCQEKIFSTDSCICRVINSPLYINIPNNQNTSQYTLLHHICNNSLGLLIDFILRTSDNINVFYIQDDDGNTPLHLLCKRVDELEKDKNDYNQTFNDFTSVPSSTKTIKVIEILSKYADLSIKNKNKLAPEDVTINTFVHNICYLQMIQKKNGKFPSSKPINNNIPYKTDWNVLFNLKDPKQKNRTLLHHLCIGDRLGAIKFLVNNGGDVNVIANGYNNYSFKPIDLLFKTMRITSNGFNYIDIKVPSGFKKCPDIISQNYKDIILDKSEKLILEETEMIAEYLVERGADFSHESYCDLSDIMYKLYKRKNSSTVKKPSKSSIVSIAKSIANGLTKYSCFPFGNIMNNVYIDDKKYAKTKFIAIPSIYNQNSESKEKLIEPPI